jgi:hypothetical protein
MDIYTAKSKVFNYLTQAQKSDLCHYIASFVKKHFHKETREIMDLFLEDERYYLEINSSRFPWLSEYIENEEFLRDLELYVKENRKKCLYKEKQKPFYEKQKAYAKEQRKKIQESKMAKQPPTKAQLSYYKALCKKHKIDTPFDPETASKLDLKNAISLILEKTGNAEKEEILNQLEEIAKSE